MASRTPHLGWLWHKGWFADWDTLTLRHFEKATLGEFEIYPPNPAQFTCWGVPTENGSWQLQTGHWKHFKAWCKENRAVYAWQGGKSMTRHLAVVASRMLLMNAESLISLPDKQQLLHSHCRKSSCQDQLCQQALLSLKHEVLADKTSNLCILGLDISTYNFKDTSQLGHLRGHTYRAGHPIAQAASKVQAILAW